MWKTLDCRKNAAIYHGVNHCSLITAMFCFKIPYKSNWFFVQYSEGKHVPGGSGRLLAAVPARRPLALCSVNLALLIQNMYICTRIFLDYLGEVLSTALTSYGNVHGAESLSRKPAGCTDNQEVTISRVAGFPSEEDSPSQEILILLRWLVGLHI